MSIRGAVKFTLKGFDLELEPSFKNLSRIEDALGLSVSEVVESAISRKLRVNNVVTIIQHCAKPCFGVRLPDWWNSEGIGQAIMDDGFKAVFEVILSFLADAIKASPTVNIISADEQEKKP